MNRPHPNWISWNVEQQFRADRAEAALERLVRAATAIHDGSPPEAWASLDDACEWADEVLGVNREREAA
jgi:hypothetical protein